MLIKRIYLQQKNLNSSFTIKNTMREIILEFKARSWDHGTFWRNENKVRKIQIYKICNTSSPGRQIQTHFEMYIKIKITYIKIKKIQVSHTKKHVNMIFRFFFLLKHLKIIYVFFQLQELLFCFISIITFHLFFYNIFGLLNIFYFIFVCILNSDPIPKYNTNKYNYLYWIFIFSIFFFLFISSSSISITSSFLYAFIWMAGFYNSTIWNKQTKMYAKNVYV